jgi:hypothetical protein
MRYIKHRVYLAFKDSAVIKNERLERFGQEAIMEYLYVLSLLVARWLATCIVSVGGRFYFILLQPIYISYQFVKYPFKGSISVSTI